MDKKNHNADKKIKMTQEEYLKSIQLKSIEKDCLDRVFTLLCELQEQPSSDDDNKQKKYLMEIEKRANQKKMRIIKDKDKYKDKDGIKGSKNSPKIEKRYKEDENMIKSQGNESKNSLKKIGVKAIRKILKKLEQEVPKDEIEMMIWVKILINK
jgi:hypothetical protein